MTSGRNSCGFAAALHRLQEIFVTFFQYSRQVALPSFAVLVLAASPVYAQTSARAAPASASAPVVQPAMRPVFGSVFGSYQPYTEEKIADWKQANDTAARIGGWRAYAKEAAEPAPARLPAPATSPANPLPAKP